MVHKFVNVCWCRERRGREWEGVEKLKGIAYIYAYVYACVIICYVKCSSAIDSHSPEGVFLMYALSFSRTQGMTTYYKYMHTEHQRDLQTMAAQHTRTCMITYYTYNRHDNILYTRTYRTSERLSITHDARDNILHLQTEHANTLY